MKRTLRALLVAAGSGMLLGAGAAVAVEAHFGGFGTAGLVCSGYDKADYVINDQPKGAGRTRTCDAGVDSLFGVQLDLELGEPLEFGLQIVADRNADRSYTPEITVAQLRWRVSENLRVRVGRMPMPSFLHAEDRLVHYAQPWARTPLEVYNLLPVVSTDGVDLIYRGHVGDWQTEWQGGLAGVAFDSPKSNAEYTYPIDAEYAYLALSLQSGGTLFKLGYQLSRLSIAQPDLLRLLQALRAFGADALADDLAVDDSLSTLVTIGARHEWNDWLLIAEGAFRTLDGFYRDQFGAYLTLGRRVGPWMPYATLARRWTRGPESDPRTPPLLRPAVDDLLASSRLDGTTLSLGLSRQLGDQAVLKLQADWVVPDAHSFGPYTNAAYGVGGPDYIDPEAVWVVSLGLDFVF